MSRQKLSKLRVDFEAGKENKTQIAKKHGLSRNQLYYLANKHGWEYGKNQQKWDNLIEQKRVDHFVSQESDERIESTNKFLKGVGLIENLCLAYFSDLARFKNDPTKQSKEDGDRAFSFLKNCKIAMETVSLGYEGKRKALKMDVPEESKSKVGDIQLVICSEGG